MADELYNTIKEAAVMYRERPGDYYRMVLNGFKQAQTFTWEKAAKAYFEIYQFISH
jgi:glycogen synthase